MTPKKEQNEKNKPKLELNHHRKRNNIKEFYVNKMKIV